MRQRVAIARTLVHDPPILILDEPAAGLDVPTAQVIEGFIAEARRRGKAIILSTQVMEEAEYLIGIALSAKSFKEAQSYLTPVVLAVVFPLMLGMLPGLQLTPALALIPLFNVCQLIKEIFLGEFRQAAFAVTMVANIVYAGAAFLAAIHVFKSERVLFRT